MNDLKQFEHGDEGTHSACDEQFKKYGGKTQCCACIGHDCDHDKKVKRQIETQEVKWSCRFHPTEWFHEIGCPHIEWTKEQLHSALVGKKKFEDKKRASHYVKKNFGDVIRKLSNE